MEILRVLEEKIAQLIQSKKLDLEIIEQLKREQLSLREENKKLSGEVTRLEEALLAQAKTREEFDEEREITKMTVDELIQNIDVLLEKELQP
ncbi:TPA: hypothetical protein DDZ86_03630 [Candidatus Dependentiae bacterium]|nr:MAG: hypothetical protein UW09_C0003G0078 [candidate division TM6 bacterium GW2011_GWF2_43_87]HBL98706.1 hypothetical protein [Candidatus Dependentiae bacterium]